MAKAPPCPRCGCEDVKHPTNYGRPQKNRWWCMKCGALWTPPRCARCEALLKPGTEVFLEYDQNTDTYSDEGDIPEKHSLGKFPFGSDCAKRAKEERAALKAERGGKLL